MDRRIEYYSFNKAKEGDKTMRLSKIVAGVEEFSVVCLEEDWEREIVSLTHDSRTASVSSLFFCLTGGESDGHSHAREAIKHGAVAIVTERRLSVKVPQIIVKDTRQALSLMSAAFYGNPAQDLQIVGITGTNGKTTTAAMLASVLEAAGKKVGVIGTLGVRYSGKTYPSALTTPDPIVLHKTFSEMRAQGIEFVVMEVSAHALYYKKVEGVYFSACIFTNCTQDHLDFFKTMQAYKEAKMLLFQPKRCQIAILNGDDELSHDIKKSREENTTVSYGVTNPADAFAIITEENLLGSECLLNIQGEVCRVSLALSGKHNVYNALAAATCALALGIKAKSVTEGLSGLRMVDGRLEWVGGIHGAEIFVDFAHTPDGLDKSISALKKHCKGRLVCLFGCGGNRDKGKRPLMGETAAKKCDFAVLTSDNPRYEDPMDILAAIEKGYRRFSLKYVVVQDRRAAIAYAIDCLTAGDVLLVAGKGGETYQEIMGIKYPFCDKDIIKNYIEEKRETPRN